MATKESQYEHNKSVIEFMKMARALNPAVYYVIMQKYPVVNSKKWRRIRDTEITFSELGDARDE